MNNSRKYLLPILFFMAIGTIHAKDTTPIDSTVFVVGYNYHVNTKDADGAPVVDSLQTVLLVGHQYTKTMGYHSFWTTINGETQETFDAMAKEWQFHVPIILKNMAEEQMTVYEDIPVQHYVYEDDGTKEWEMLGDTLTVNGFLCNKAQTRYGGRTWTVWYAEEVASTAGPWKFHGLPGLIVKCSDDAGIFCFELFELVNKVFPITNDENNRSHPNKKITREKFIERRNKLFLNPRYPSDPLYYHQSSEADDKGYALWSLEKTPRNPDGSISLLYLTRKINGVAVPWKANEYQPLEIE